MKQMDRDFGAGGLLFFALPTVASMLFEALYAVVDGLFVARLVHIDAFGAITLLMPFLMTLVGVAMAIGTGGGAIVAKLLGEKNESEARSVFSLLALALLCAAILIAFFSLGAKEYILDALGAEGSLYDYAKDYYEIIGVGIAIYLGQYFFQYMFIVAGVPKYALIAVICAGLANIGLDYLFIAEFGWGISGAAWATLIASLIPNAIGIVYFCSRKHTLYFAVPSKRFSVIVKSFLNGFHALLNMLSFSVVSYIINITLLDLAGKDGIAAISVVGAIDFLAITLFVGLSSGLCPLHSFNLGAGRFDRIRKQFFTALKTIAIAQAAVLAFIYIFAKELIAIYTPISSPVFEMALIGTYIFFTKYLFDGFIVYFANLFTAFHRGLISAVITAARSFIVAIPLLLILPKFMGINGVWIALPIAEVATFLLSVYFLKRISPILKGKTPNQ